MANTLGPGTGPLTLDPHRLPAPHGMRHPEPAAHPRTAATTVLPFLCALATGGLLWLCHFPMAWGWLAWVALVPLLCLMRMDLSARKLALLAYVAGLVFFFPVMRWMTVADHRMIYTWLALSLYCSLYFPLGIWLVRRLDRHTALPLVLTLPAVWTTLEYLRSFVMTGFAWYFLGHTQHDFLPVIQIADLGGAYAVTFVVAAGNAVAFEWLCVSRRFRELLGVHVTPVPWFRRLRDTAAVLFLVSSTLAYGHQRLAQTDFAPGPRLALIQGNLDQRLKDAAQAGADDARTSVFEHYQRLCDQAAARAPRPDLIVWPETSWPGVWIESPPGQPDADCRKMGRWLADRWATNHLIGLNACLEDAPGRQRLYNSAVFFGADAQAGKRYDKIHRVPFGEYVPLRDWLPWMNYFAPYDFDYSVRAGESLTRFPLGAHTFGVLICYEDTDPVLARGYVDPGHSEPDADFLLNISNDGWFDGSSEHEEHLAVCRFRAVEARRAVARAVNMGVSALIDPNGRVLAAMPAGGAVYELTGEHALPISEWARFKKVPAVLVGTVPIDGRASFYAKWGDWLPQLCGALVAAAFAWSLRRAATPLAA